MIKRKCNKLSPLYFIYHTSQVNKEDQSGSPPPTKKPKLEEETKQEEKDFWMPDSTFKLLPRSYAHLYIIKK